LSSIPPCCKAITSTKDNGRKLWKVSQNKSRNYLYSWSKRVFQVIDEFDDIKFKNVGAEGVAEAVECLPSKHKALNSYLSIAGRGESWRGETERDRKREREREYP
jgi:hypothetical protein